MTNVMNNATWSKDYSDLSSWPVTMDAHERYVTVQISKRRYYIAELTIQKITNASLYAPGLTGFFKNHAYRAVTIPLSFPEAMKALAWLLANATGRETGDIPADIRNWIKNGPELT